MNLPYINPKGSQVLKIIVFCIAALLASPSWAQIRVVDGDTLELNGTTYRLNGIDAPEFGQTCQSKAGLWNCGAVALDTLAGLVKGRVVTCQPVTSDPYGRVIATCLADGKDLGAAMVSTGQAWAFVKFSDVYVHVEAQAKARALGIWSGENQAAWDYRAARWDAARQTAPDGCPIKGNISRNGRIYHPPWSPWYNRTRINEAKGERWFCDEAEAISAGWRAPRWP